MINQNVNIIRTGIISLAEKPNYIIRHVLFLLLLLWCTGFFLPVFNIKLAGITFIHFVLKNFYSIICNQSNNATFSVNNHLLFVCARCTGLYVGAFATSLFFFICFKKRFELSLKPIIISSIPMLIDALSVRVGFYNYSKIVAFTTGFFCGSIIFTYILEVLENSLTPYYTKKYEI